MPNMEKEKRNSQNQPEQYEEYTSPQKQDQNKSGVTPAQEIRKDSDSPSQRHDGQTENY